MIDTSTAGDHTVTCNVTDNAGNASSATIHYTVQYMILGVFSPAPGSRRKLGQTVAVAAAVDDVNGVRVSGVEGAGFASACRVTFSASGAQAITGQCMKYDAKNREFTFDWVLPKKGTTGADTIAVTVTYPNTTTSTSKADRSPSPSGVEPDRLTGNSP